MIATCSVEKRNVDVRGRTGGPTDRRHVNIRLIQETISSCRFAQRVAKVQNKAVLNEEEDPQLVIVHSWTTAPCYCR